MSSSSTKQDAFNSMTKKYLDNVLDTSDGSPELEIRFGTRGVRPIAKIDYDNVIQKLMSSGFYMPTDPQYSLKIQNEYVDSKTGVTKLSNIRTEISGLSNIQEYCKENKLDEIRAVTFQQKNYAMANGKPQYPINFDDFNFRISYQKERNLSRTSGIIRNTIATWPDNKKVFRYINRVTLVHKSLPFKVDLSIVKESHKERRQYVPEYSFEAARVLESQEKYEIEIEVDNSQVGPGTKYSSGEKSNNALASALRKGIKYILSGLQGTNYPISYPDQHSVAQQYLKLIQGDKYQEKYLYPRNFIGPSSYTLQVQNIAPINEDSVIPNIRNNYTVTDKADGTRKLLFISSKGRYI